MARRALYSYAWIMSTSTILPPSAVTLRRDHLSFTDVVAQAIGTVAPSGAAALAIPGVFAAAGGATWLVYLLATLALLLVSLNLTMFSSRSASPGALFTYAAQGLGPAWGVVSGWSLVIAYTFGTVAVVGGAISQLLLIVASFRPALAEAMPQVPLLLALTLLIGLTAWRSVRLSTRLSLGFEAATVASIAVVIVLWVLHDPARSIDPSQARVWAFDPHGLQVGLVLAVFAFSGFESGTALGAEARNPLRSIPRSIVATVLIVGLFLVVVSYFLAASVGGVAPQASQGVVAGATAASPSLAEISRLAGTPLLGTIIAAGVALSFFASGLGAVNASSRILFAFANHRILPSVAARAHASNATPHVAILAVTTVVGLLSVSADLLGLSSAEIFDTFGTISSFGFLLSYLLVSIAAPVFLRRRGELRGHHVLVSAASVVLLLLPIEGSLFPVPDYPANLLPFIFAAVLGAGVLHIVALARWHPGRLVAIEDELGIVEAPAAALTA